jgi:hypothetical protein
MPQGVAREAHAVTAASPQATDLRVNKAAETFIRQK